MTNERGMSDIVERLLTFAKSAGAFGGIYREAATAIEARDAEIARLREAIEYYEIGVSAVGVPHEGERKVLHDCVAKARSIRAALKVSP